MERLRDWIKQLIERLGPWIDWIKRTVAIYLDNNMSVYAGNATLFMITAVFPFLMLLIAIVNLLPGYSAEDVCVILFQLLPDLEPIRHLVEGIVENLRNQSGGLLASAAAVTTLWSASLGVSAIQKGLNKMDHLAEKSKGKGTLKDTIKGIVKRLGFTLTLLLLFPLLLLVEMLGDNLTEVIVDALEKLGLEGIENTVSSIFQISAWVVAVFALLVILHIYAKLPLRKKTLKSQIPGALITGACWYVFTELFAFFIPRFYHGSKLYGSLAALFLVLLWIRIVIMILFAGGALNYTLEEEKEESVPA